MTQGHDERTRIGDYELVQRIGRGPRAEVWCARSPSGRELALKVFHPEITRRPAFVTLFEKETSALTALHHHNILAADQRGKIGGQHFVTMEYVRAGSLRDVMRRGPIPAQRAARIATSICQALDVAHRRGLPHRHLVPENVFLDAKDGARVSDFGLALLGGGPEDASAADARGDLYALGVMLSQMTEAPGKRGSKRLDEIIARATAPSSLDRFARASEMELALHLVSANGLSNGMLPKSRSDPPRAAIEFTVRNKVLFLTVGANVTPATMRQSLTEVETLLGAGGPWKIAYDLCALSVMDGGVQDVLLNLHLRHQRNLDRVAFCSPRALVRSSALVLGGSVRRVPWKVFAAPQHMQRWIEGEAAS